MTKTYYTIVPGKSFNEFFDNRLYARYLTQEGYARLVRAPLPQPPTHEAIKNALHAVYGFDEAEYLPPDVFSQRAI